MNTKPNVALRDFKRFSEAKILAFSDAVIAALSKNDNFPTAATLLAELVTAQQVYSTALSSAKDGGRVQAAEKNVAKAAVIAVLDQLCSLVTFVADGNRVKLLSSGFDISKEIAVPVVIEPAKNVIINYGASSGEMHVVVKGAKGHKGLVYEYALATEKNEIAADSNWISYPSSSTQCTIVNMPVGRRVLIRIGIAGPRRQLVYTAPIVRLVA